MNRLIVVEFRAVEANKLRAIDCHTQASDTHALLKGKLKGYTCLALALSINPHAMACLFGGSIQNDDETRRSNL
jgi:hypothetical protein